MTRSEVRLGIDDVQAAARRIHQHVRRTPLLRVQSLPGIGLKAEHLQRSGSFKIRGAANALLAQPAAHVVAGSSGNHGIAVATVGRSLGVQVTIVMAAGASTSKAAVLQDLGARVLRVAGGVSERDRFAREYAASVEALLVPSSDDELVMAGQGTVGLEVLQDLPDVDVIFVPTGGGGLLAGICLAAYDRRVRIVGVEPATACRYAQSMAAGRPVSLPASDTIADGLRGQQPGNAPWPVITGRVNDLISVRDSAIVRAMNLLRDAGIAAEPTGSVALAGALKTSFKGTAAVVVSGGNGITTSATLPATRKDRHDFR